ncbi:hypothetical protein HH310_30885 [Actinoplanes sp. TBRC 11911]|uniref:hypothetical protein n=1 Tax=Actinoplanes sp. TBRC 11911 TaxID=2729386 RepID=UPI00145E31F3|nr:hypothetical protein [Actinoplanes sp. TBRC 11911]NMO55579.1 hypothetical protein [Actinoplanes sp. TBRC 11911]
MDRADDAPSDVAASVPRGSRGVGRGGDMMYRRPAAQPEAVAGSWFGLGTATTAPDPGPGPARVSYGFSAGPISPNRQVAAPIRPALPAAPTAFDPLQDSPTLDQPAIAGPVGQSESPVTFGPLRSSVAADRQRSPVTIDQRPVTTDEFEALRPRVDVRAEPPRGVEVHPEPPRGAETHAEPPRAADVRAEPPPRRSRLFTFGVVVLSAIVLLGGSIVGVVYFSGDSGTTVDAAIQAGVGNTAKRTVTAPLNNRTKAAFELLAGADVVNLSIKDLGDDLYRISTPDNAGIRPSPQVRDDAVKLQVAADGNGGGGEIDVVLAAKVRWSLRFTGYAEERRLDLSGGRVTGIEMVAGTGKAAVTLARASGTVPVKISGAVNELVLKSPSDSPVRVRVDGGAKSVVAGSRALQDVAAGSTLTPRNWATQDRYDVAVGARITSLTVENA